MNVNLASANMAQQFANNTMQSTAQPLKTPEDGQQVQSAQPLQAVPEEPSRESRPVQESSDSAAGRSIDIYV